MENSIKVTELLELLSRRKFVIYGAGYVALKFYEALKIRQLDKNISCFIVSTFSGSDEKIEGLPIRGVDWLKKNKDIVVCIAVHEALMPEIIGTMQNIGVSDYFWIYPYLYELLLGAPIKVGTAVNLNDVIHTCMDDYRLAIRYMAIDNYLGKNAIGFDMYKRAQALHSSPKTAEERLIKFCELINQWQQNGYNKNSRILINERYEVIDGIHRVTLAKYYNLQEIVCDIFPGDFSASELHGANVMLTRQALLRGGFSEEEFERLDEISEAIKGGKQNGSAGKK